jgi:hypothetical protein
MRLCFVIVNTNQMSQIDELFWEIRYKRYDVIKESTSAIVEHLQKRVYMKIRSILYH